MAFLFTSRQIYYALYWYNYTKQNFLMRKSVIEKEPSKIGVNIKKFSKKNGVSKSELVRRTGLDYHTIAKIERGVTPDPRVHTVVKIASALGITVEELVK